MSQPCSYCSGPIRDLHSGRPRPSQSAPIYCCYGCLSLGEQDRAHPTPRTNRGSFNLGVRFAVGLFVIAQSMIFGLAVSLEEDTSPAVKLAVQLSILAGTVLVLFLLGGPLFTSAWRELSGGKITLEAMFLLTLSGAMIASMQSLIGGDGPVYFEVVSVLVVVYTLGKELTARTRSAAMESSRLWLNEIETARRLVGGREEEVPTSTLRVGDLVVVRPGEMVPLDGTIVRGEGLVSEAPINGEPMPQRKVPGDSVHAGAASYDARFEIEATSECGTRRIDALTRVLEGAQRRLTSSQAFADRIGSLLFPLTVLVALATFAIWTHRTDWRTGLFHSMSVLLVACPCAIGLATPLVIWSTLSRLAERGLVLNSGEAVEKLATIDLAFFDKTGTLSEERLEIQRIHWLAEAVNRDEMLALLRRIEAESDHPVARAFRDLSEPEAFATECGNSSLTLHVVPGIGIEGELTDGESTRRFRVGSLPWIDLLDIARSNRQIGFELDGIPILVVELAERVRPSVDAALDDLRTLGIRVGMLTGDPIPREIAGRFDLVREGLLPDGKARVIRESQTTGNRVLMVGDGTNDAAGLAQADVGIALASGTDLANGVACGTLHHGDLRVLPWAVALSRDAVRRIRASLYRSVAYNAVGVSLAACGVLHPVVAVLLMIVSSLLVMWSSIRVGVEPVIACRSQSDGEERFPFTAIAHGVFFSLQGLLIAELLGRERMPLFLAFGVTGLLLAWGWHRWRSQPHWFDMTVGMLTFGNFGMLLGWLADNDFRPLRLLDCCACSEIVRGNFSTPWMWLGMLGFANLAMCLPRNRNHVGHLSFAMFTGGNLGMMLGMVAGGWLAGRIEMATVAGSFTLSYFGMTLGMIVGMIAMSELTQRSLPAIISLRRFPYWMSRTESVPSPGERDAERTTASHP